MTDLDTLDLIDLADVGDAGLHMECCAEPKFYCGAPFHPEAAADDDDAVEDYCKACIVLFHEGLCPPHQPTHQHCPLLPRRICAP